MDPVRKILPVTEVIIAELSIPAVKLHADLFTRNKK
jgi:hypothetical protein